MHYLHAYTRAAASADPNAPIVWTASTEGKKTDGLDLRQEDWSLDRFLRHNVILFAHDYTGNTLPLGTGDPYFENRNLMIKVRFDTDDPFAMRVKAKAQKGMMGGSVGWQDVKLDGRTKHELLEFSIVPMPLDANCLPVLGARALQLAIEYAELTDTTPADFAVIDAALKRLERRLRG